MCICSVFYNKKQSKIVEKILTFEIDNNSFLQTLNGVNIINERQ